MNMLWSHCQDGLIDLVIPNQDPSNGILGALQGLTARPGGDMKGIFLLVLHLPKLLCTAGAPRS